MTSNDFSTIHVIDDRLKFWDKAQYAVKTGGQSITSVIFNAQSQSVNSHSFQIQVPSKDIVCDRRIMWSSSVVIKVVGKPAEDKFLINMGQSMALSPFPLHQLTTTMQCQINSNSLSVNTRDILAPMLKIHDRPTLNSFNATTPTHPDGAYYYYDDAYYGGGDPAQNNPLSDHMNSSLNNDFVPRGSFVIDAIGSVYDPATNSVSNAQDVGTNGGAIRTSYIKFTVSEPLICLSPWTFASESSLGGLYGITNLTFTFNMDASNTCRALRWASLNLRGDDKTSITDCQVMGYNSSSLTMTFITPQSTQVLPSRCIVPYYECPRYITQCQEIPPDEVKQVVLNTIALNSIPDYLIIFCRKPIAQQRGYDSDSFFSIESISMNFNNNSGLLSGTPKNILYNISRQNNLNASWNEWNGRTVSTKNAVNANNVSICRTGGAPLILQFGKDIQLPSYLCAGSLGNFNLQFTLGVLNQALEAIAPELVVITVNSGIFVSHGGTSSVFTGVLSRSDVLDASQTTPLGHQDVRRLIGNGFLDKLKSIGSDVFDFVKRVAPVLAPVAKNLLNSSGNSSAQTLGKVLGAVGYGDSGGSALRRHAR